jgi:hydrogenase nickel incorporation protein HypA/HybF
MHEIALCEGIVESVERHRRGRDVGKVTVQVGFLRQIDPESLSFAWEMVTSGGPLDGAELEIFHVPATVMCAQCGARTVLDMPVPLCGSCGGAAVQVVTGDELTVVSPELATV